MTAEQLADSADMRSRYPNPGVRLKKARLILRDFARSGYLVEVLPGQFFPTEAGIEASAALNAAVTACDADDLSSYGGRDDSRRRNLAKGVWVAAE